MISDVCEPCSPPGDDHIDLQALTFLKVTQHITAAQTLRAPAIRFSDCLKPQEMPPKTPNGPSANFRPAKGARRQDHLETKRLYQRGGPSAHFRKRAEHLSGLHLQIAPWSGGQIYIKYRKVDCTPPGSINIELMNVNGGYGWLRLTAQVTFSAPARTHLHTLLCDDSKDSHCSH